MLIVCHLVLLYICCEVNIPHVLTWNAGHVKSAIVIITIYYLLLLFHLVFIVPRYCPITKLYIFRVERFNIL